MSKKTREICPFCGSAADAGWISVNERRPDTDDPVLVIDVIGDMMIDSRDSFHSICVTHWQPLPEPPK